MRNLPYAKKHILYAMAKYLVLDYYEFVRKLIMKHFCMIPY